MKLTKSKLKQIIEEEAKKALQERSVNLLRLDESAWTWIKHKIGKLGSLEKGGKIAWGEKGQKMIDDAKAKVETI